MYYTLLALQNKILFFLLSYETVSRIICSRDTVISYNDNDNDDDDDIVIITYLPG